MNYTKLTPDIHRKHAKGLLKVSHWLINKPLRRRIRVQCFKGRLYLIGGITDLKHVCWLLPFECPISELNRIPGIRFESR